MEIILTELLCRVLAGKKYLPKPVHSRRSFNWLKNEVLNSLLNGKSTVVLIHIFWNLF